MKEGTIVDRLKDVIKVGDHIEKIGNKSVVGTRHFEVAKLLRDVPVGSTLKMRLIEPNSFGFRTLIIFSFYLIKHNVFFFFYRNSAT